MRPISIESTMLSHLLIEDFVVIKKRVFHMNPGTVIVKSLVKGHIHQLKPHTIEITSSMIKAFRGAHGKNKFDLEEGQNKTSFELF